MGGAQPALMHRKPFGKQPVNSQFRLVSWPLLALVSPLLTKSSVVKAARLERRLSRILRPLLSFLSALQVPEASFRAPLTFTNHLTLVPSLRVGTTGCWSDWRALWFYLP